MKSTAGAGILLALIGALPVSPAAAQDPLAGAIVGGALGGIVGGALLAADRVRSLVPQSVRRPAP